MFSGFHFLKKLIIATIPASEKISNTTAGHALCIADVDSAIIPITANMTDNGIIATIKVNTWVILLYSP